MKKNFKANLSHKEITIDMNPEVYHIEKSLMAPPLIVSRFSFNLLSLIAFFFLEVQFHSVNIQQGQGSFEHPTQPLKNTLLFCLSDHVSLLESLPCMVSSPLNLVH